MPWPGVTAVKRPLCETCWVAYHASVAVAPRGQSRPGDFLAYLPQKDRQMAGDYIPAGGAQFNAEHDDFVLYVNAEARRGGRCGTEWRVPGHLDDALHRAHRHRKHGPVVRLKQGGPRWLSMM